ncbi:Cytochrome C oxidase, cbb3-type, subunit III [Tistlia consotensis]|uniref:Cytochrome C oxidase, cbb3-type, subunit III n=1 Tax=Tistlia consotensis USBA 355 TaxID=560819 RepID=A0A1Y6CND4_9PROT|nr:cytochrome c [Tistlia consotensis]SMF77211.1 Cytochrome C oxidase, cbb3-type, subunit III [Tistlia consotensis USBA 355]SNS14432.1 Cytochrome C oxidase, cbb3-type, subunit III [Tistlia consotensis]
MEPGKLRKALRPLGGAAALLALTLLAGSGAAAKDIAAGAHGEALGALTDLQSALGELDKAAGLTVSDPDPYRQAARRAVNALVGKAGAGFDAAAGDPGDAAGALGHLGRLRDAAGDRPWAAAVQAAWVNAMVAKAGLDDALKADELEDFQSRMSGALEALLVAIGRVSDRGAFGGLRGALATTELGVPPDAPTLPGCALQSGTLPSGAPSDEPAYGVVGGYLTYVAVPTHDGRTELPEPFGVGSITVRDGRVVLETASAALTGKLCGKRQQAKAAAPTGTRVAAADPAPALYTEAQAEQGHQIFKSHCAVCHGEQLQGKSAPTIAGPDFLKKAQLLGWSVADLRQVVTTTMPRDNPGSLSPEQYARVLSYLLAVNCYPPGKNRFPTTATASLHKAALQPPDGVKPDLPGPGICSLKTAAR